MNARLGYVGLGAMGGALARRLMLSHPLRVHDLDTGKVSGFADAGATPCQTASSLAAECDVVMTCLPTSNEVREAVFGPGGIAEGLEPGGMIVDMTTGDPGATRTMAEEAAARGLKLIDAPVSGGPHGATAGTIAIMVGGDEADYERVLPALHSISPNVFHCGDVGAGHAMKLVNNVVAAGVRALTLEAVTMGAKQGLDLDRMAEVLAKGSARSYTTEITLPRLVDGSFAANFTLGLMLKDVSLACQLGADAAAPMPMAGLVRETLRAALVEHGAGADVNMLIRSMERAAAAKVVPDG